MPLFKTSKTYFTKHITPMTDIGLICFSATVETFGDAHVYSPRRQKSGEESTDNVQTAT